MSYHHSKNETPINLPNYGVCRDMLRKSIADTGITYWNIALVTPNLLFLIFIGYHVGIVSRILFQYRSPVVKCLLALVFSVSALNVFRGFLSTILNTIEPDHFVPNEVLWLLCRFLLLAVEMSVIGFGLFGFNGVGQKVVSVSFYLSLVYTVIQTIFEFTHSNHAKVFKKKYMMFQHGGMLFWFISATIFFAIYSGILILPKAKILCARGFLSLPANRAFYRYAALLCIINLFQSIGSMLVYSHIPVGLCILNSSVLLYYSLYSALVYFTFLRKSFIFLKCQTNDESASSSTESSASSSQLDLAPNGLV